jgi:hypothetical protein
MKRILSAVVAVACLSLSLPAFAAHPLATDDAGTTGKMKFQVETSADFAWDKQDTVKSDSQVFNLSATAGLLDSVDLVIGTSYTWQNFTDSGSTLLNNSGINDLSLEIKWRFLELGPASFAIKPAVVFPTGDYDRSLGAGRAAYGATLISTVEFKELSMPVALHANAGYTYQDVLESNKDTARKDIWSFSLAGNVEVMKGLQLVAEVGTASNPESGNAVWPTFITGGAIYSAFEWLDLSLGVKGGLTTPETDITMLAGLTFKFP